MRTEVHLPDELYERLKRLAAEEQWSLAETLLRGAEILLTNYPFQSKAGKAWVLEPPANTDLLEDPFANPAWREAVNIGLPLEGRWQQAAGKPSVDR